MEIPRPPRSTDPLGSAPYKPPTLSGDRFSVQDVEKKVRSMSRRREYNTSRSRREQRAEKSSFDQYIWFVVALVAAAYLSFLAWNIIKPGAPPAEPPVAAQPVAEPVEEVPVVEAVIAPVAVADAPPELLMLEETVTSLKRAKALYDEAVRLMRDKQLDEADAKFEAAAELMPGNFAVLLDWSMLLREQKQWSAARDHLIKAVAIDPSSIPARVALAQCCFQLRQFSDSLAMANWVLETETYSEPAHQIAADVYFGLEQYQDAIRHLQKLVALSSNNRIAANNLGLAYLKLGQHAQAIRTFESVIRDEPSNSQAYYYLAVCFLLKNEPELAVDVLVRASAQFGREFVLSWTTNPEFAPLQNLPSFQQQFSVPVAAP